MRMEIVIDAIGANKNDSKTLDTSPRYISCSSFSLWTDRSCIVR